MQWHYLSETQERIAVRDRDLAKMAESGIIRSETLVWKEGMEEWVSCGEIRPQYFDAKTGPEDVSTSSLAALARRASSLASTGRWVRWSGIACLFLAIIIFVACAELIIRRPEFFTSGGMMAIVLKNTAVVLAVCLGCLSIQVGLVSHKLAPVLPGLNALDEKTWADFGVLQANYNRALSLFLLCLVLVAFLGSVVYLFL